MSGLEMKVFPRMGDRLAEVIIGLYSAVDRVDEMVLRKILTAVRVSFSAVGCVDDPSYREPVATIRLLELISSKATSEVGRILVRELTEQLRLPGSGSAGVGRGADDQAHETGELDGVRDIAAEPD